MNIYFISAANVTTVSTVKGSEFGFREGQRFSPFYVVQTDSGAHSASSPKATGGKAAGAWS
jgi:hypothetical protein